jgi:hypothetical protein
VPRKPSIESARTARDFRSAVVRRWKKIWGPSLPASTSAPAAELDDDAPREIYKAPNRDPLRFLGGRPQVGGRRIVSRDDDDEN